MVVEACGRDVRGLEVFVDVGAARHRELVVVLEGAIRALAWEPT